MMSKSIGLAPLMFTVTVSVEPTSGPCPPAPVIETHTKHVVAHNWDEACDVAIGEVFESYGDQCNLVDYWCPEEGLKAS